MSEIRENINLVVLTGRVAAEAEHKVFDSGTEYWRILVVTRVDMPRRRTDVIPVTWWGEANWPQHPKKGDQVRVIGQIQRRYWEASSARQSRLEVIAEVLEFEHIEEKSYAPTPYGSASYVPRSSEEEE